MQVLKALGASEGGINLFVLTHKPWWVSWDRPPPACERLGGSFSKVPLASEELEDENKYSCSPKAFHRDLSGGWRLSHSPLHSLLHFIEEVKPAFISFHWTLT